MPTFGQEVISAATQHVGKDFEHHFKPTDYCHGGRSPIDLCFQRGLGPNSFDCSGLILASVCEVEGKELSEVPKELRHFIGLYDLVDFESQPREGDIVVGFNIKNRPHGGLYTATGDIIHASGRTKKVEKDPSILGRAPVLHVIPIESLSKSIAN